MNDAPARRFWRSTLRLTAGLLLAWLALNLAVPWFARELNAVQVFGFPLGYWLAAEGMLLLYLLIIVVYVLVMDRLEGRYLHEIGAEDTLALPRDAQRDSVLPG